MKLATTEEALLDDALARLAALTPHTQSGRDTETWKTAYEVAYASALAAAEAYITAHKE